MISRMHKVFILMKRRDRYLSFKNSYKISVEKPYFY